VALTMSVAVPFQFLRGVESSCWRRRVLAWKMASERCTALERRRSKTYATSSGHRDWADEPMLFPGAIHTTIFGERGRSVVNLMREERPICPCN
jgi:hypothetical protein